MDFTWNDGGRQEAGWKPGAGDCVCRAISIATETPYDEVYAELRGLGEKERQTKKMSRRSHPRTGVYRKTYEKYLTALGWTWTPTMQIGSGCQVHMRSDELPGGRIIVSLSKHLSAIVDGVVHDLYDPSRDGTRCVYGYYTKGNA